MSIDSFIPTKDYEEVRKGPGVKWKHETMHGIMTGYQIDNLNTKTIKEAESNYEKVFILVREALEKKESYCMDVESERLQCCQDIADVLRRNSLIIK